LGYGQVYFSDQVVGSKGDSGRRTALPNRNYPILPNVNPYMASATANLMSIDESILNLLEALGCGGLLLTKRGGFSRPTKRRGGI
jgi:hypothetical protein